MQKDSSRIVSFRLSGDALKELDAQAEKGEASAGDVARDHTLTCISVAKQRLCRMIEGNRIGASFTD